MESLLVNITKTYKDLDGHIIGELGYIRSVVPVSKKSDKENLKKDAKNLRNDLVKAFSAYKRKV